MEFKLSLALEILEQTPKVINELTGTVSPDWTDRNEGKNSWSPYDILGHLIYGEKTDWIPRIKIIMSHEHDKRFKPFDRYAQINESKGKSMKQLIVEFNVIRQQNLGILRSLKIKDSDLKRKGLHPVFGEVNLRQLLSTWVVHDLGHLAQISRTMAKQYKSEVGPWIQYLGVLTKY
jgi:hypothetical protein